MIGKTIRDLKILSQIGKGGMGVVYLAEHVRLEKKFAVKCLTPQLTSNPQFVERFDKEAKAQARLSHQNIVQISDFFENEGQFYLVMEYVDGDSLEDVIKRRHALPEKEALSLFKDILGGLNYAHSKGIIHRDIKPSNILLTKDGTAKIMDFGIALMTGVERNTRTGTAIGSPHYMSPEQIRNPKAMDHRSDVYSAGIVLYEMLTGQVPFEGNTDADVQLKHITDKPQDIRIVNKNISQALSDVVMKALEKNPDDRFSGCGEVARALEKCTAFTTRFSHVAEDEPLQNKIESQSTVPLQQTINLEKAVHYR